VYKKTATERRIQTHAEVSRDMEEIEFQSYHEKWKNNDGNRIKDAT